MVHVESARQMFEAVTKEAETADIIVKAAAVADYRPAVVADEKIKKKDGDMSIALERTDDIIGTLVKRNVIICSFADFQWRRNICLRIQKQSLKRKILI